MAMGRRKTERQDALFITADNLPKSQGHPFYQALNRLLADAPGVGCGVEIVANTDDASFSVDAILDEVVLVARVAMDARQIFGQDEIPSPGRD